MRNCELQGGYMWDWVWIGTSQLKHRILFSFLLIADLQFT